MYRLKRFLAASGLVGLVAALAFAAPAQATNIKAVCLVSGKAFTGGKNGFSTDRGVKLFGGEGTFIFGSIGMVCVGGGPVKGDKTGPQTVTLNVDADGWYKNLTCFNGKVVGTVGGLTGKYGDELNGRKFALEFGFPAGLPPATGHFFWHDYSKDELGDLIPKASSIDGSWKDPYDVKDWEWAGLIDLSSHSSGDSKPPPDPEKTKDGQPNPECATDFVVSGVVLVHTPNEPV